MLYLPPPARGSLRRPQGALLVVVDAGAAANSWDGSSVVEPPPPTPDSGCCAAKLQLLELPSHVSTSERSTRPPTTSGGWPPNKSPSGFGSTAAITTAARGESSGREMVRSVGRPVGRFDLAPGWFRPSRATNGRERASVSR